MATRRPYRRPARRTRKATPWYNRKYSTLQLAKKAWMATKYLKGLVNSERQYHQTTLTGSPTADIYNLQLISQGDSSGTRTGNSLLARSLYIRGHIQINASVPVATRVSLVLLQDKQQIADQAPTLASIFTSTSPEATLVTTNNGYSAGRFKIIWRQNYVLVNGQRPVITINKFFKLYSHIKFNGSNSADIQSNGYYLAILTSEATNTPAVSLITKLGYHDN